MAVDTIQITGTGDASLAEDTVYTTASPPAGEVWYIDSIRVVGEAVKNTSTSQRTVGIRVGTTVDGAPSLLTTKLAAKFTVEGGTTANYQANASLGAYVVSGEGISVRLVSNIASDITSGTLHYVIHIRRIL